MDMYLLSELEKNTIIHFIYQIFFLSLLKYTQMLTYNGKKETYIKTC